MMISTYNNNGNSNNNNNAVHTMQQQQHQHAMQIKGLLANFEPDHSFFVTPQQPDSKSLVSSSRKEDEDLLLAHAHKEYKAGNYNITLEHCNAVYEKNPLRTDNLLLLGAVYYQLRNFDMCIAKNKEALEIDPEFAECYGNMANACKEKGSIDTAIHLYHIALKLRPTFSDAWSNLAGAYMRKGLLNEAAECCRRALAINPQLVDAHSNLGNLYKAQGFTQAAYFCYMEALRIQPRFAIAWSNLAGLFSESGDYQKALAYYKEAIKLKPNFPDAYLHQGNAFRALGRIQDAIMSYKSVLHLRPDSAIAFGNLASIYYEQGQFDLAIRHYRQALILDPTYLEAINNLGNALKESGRVTEAIECYQSCLRLQSTHPQALTNLGSIYLEWNVVSAAANFYKAAIAVTTGLSAPYNNLATIYKQQGHHMEAIACYNEVLRIDPSAADCLVNRGNTFKEMGRVNEAIQDYSHAVAIRPTMAEAHANLASAYKDSGLVEAALKYYRQALLLRSDFPEATCNLLHTLQSVCYWEDRNIRFIEVEKIVRNQIKMSLLPSVQPFHAIAYPFEPLLALEISRKYAEHCSVVASRFGQQSFKYPLPVSLKGDGGSGRLRVGYVSSDFNNHPLSHLMASVFGMHNRKNIEVFCFALTPSDGSEWRRRIESEVEHFTDVSAFPSNVIARMISDAQIQILINLNGYTKGARNEIFAMKPAPVQVSYMGFPGTTGATYIDYLITDEFVSPTSLSHVYSEKLVQMPHCYFVNDYKQQNKDVLDPKCLPKRSDYGLPEDKFLFACFNQLYKIDPDTFKAWCNIVKRVPNSALWLLRFPAAGEPRLRAFAASQGVLPEQLIFTDIAAKSEHIRRCSMANLCLDTPLCNGHTTGTDVLWAGVPIITLPLEKMATRVAGSLCYAAGCGDDMVVKSMKEYEDRAVWLALNPSICQAITSKLRAARTTCPLFDTTRWVRNVERAYFKMWNLYCTTKQPQPFRVTENDLEFPCDHL